MCTLYKILSFCNCRKKMLFILRAQIAFRVVDLMVSTTISSYSSSKVSKKCQQKFSVTSFLRAPSTRVLCFSQNNLRWLRKKLTKTHAKLQSASFSSSNLLWVTNSLLQLLFILQFRNKYQCVRHASVSTFELP